MKVFIAIAVWGQAYTRIFLDICLASQLAPGNIPAAVKAHRLTYHILTTRDDAAWLRRQPLLKLLGKYADVHFEHLESLGFDASAVPTGPEGAKYKFLSILQNVAIERSLSHDALIFNYADFVWGDGSLTNAIGMLGDTVDAVLSFCLPVDLKQGMARLEAYRSPAAGDSTVLALPARDGAAIAIDCLHREGKLRYWEDPAFTVTPTYLLWPVGTEGVVVRAYHQTILVLKVRADDPEYRRGIVNGSLDAYFTAILAKRPSVAHATNSDSCLVFSLYDTIVQSQIGGPSRIDWTGYDRDASMRECLRGVVSLEQRKFALIPIEVRRSSDKPEAWGPVIEQSRSILERLHSDTPFDPWEYERLHTEGISLESAAEQWRQAARSALSMRKSLLRLIPPRLRREAATAARVLYGRLMTALAGRLAVRIKKAIGPARARAIRVALQERLFGVRPTAGGALPSFPDRPPEDAEALELLASARTAELLLWLDHYSSVITIAPGFDLPHRAGSCIATSVICERNLASLSDLALVGRILLGTEVALRELVALAPPWSAGHWALGQNLWFQGRFDEAIEAFSTGESCLPLLAPAAGWGEITEVFLPRNCAQVIGLMGHIDAFVKMRALTGDRRTYRLVAVEGDIVNSAFLDYWCAHIDVDIRPPALAAPTPIESALTPNWNWVLPAEGGKIVHVHRGMARIQRQWAAEGRPPLLTLSRPHAELLDWWRKRKGMAAGDWYVCLHVRTPGFYKEKPGTAQEFRNTRIDDYYPMIRMVAESGGWIVRMGDPSMPPLDLTAIGPAAARVIDYAVGNDRTPTLDVVLCAGCRLFVSSPSGLHTVAHAFGRPACYVNFPIYAGFPWHPGEIIAPKIYHSRHHGRALTVDEILSGKLVHADHQFLLDVAGVDLRDNSAEVVMQTVREALFPDDVPDLATPKALEVREAFDAANRRYGVDISGRLSLGFAGAYADELLPVAGTYLR